MANSERDSRPQQPVEDRRSSPGQVKRQQRHSRRSVFQYLAILFGAAFLLLLLTYVMQQRVERAQDQIDDLQESSNSALQTLENIIAERDKLKEENEILSEDLQQAWQDVQQAQAQLEEQERSLQAMDWFWRIQRQFSRGYTNAARELAEAFEASGLVDDLPDTAPAEPDGPSPAQQYQELYDLLF